MTNKYLEKIASFDYFFSQAVDDSGKDHMSMRGNSSMTDAEMSATRDAFNGVRQKELGKEGPAALYKNKGNLSVALDTSVKDPKGRITPVILGAENKARFGSHYSKKQFSEKLREAAKASPLDIPEESISKAEKLYSSYMNRRYARMAGVGAAGLAVAGGAAYLHHEKRAETYSRERYNNYVRDRKDTEGSITKGSITGATLGLGYVQARDVLAAQDAARAGKHIPLEEVLHRNMNMKRIGKAMAVGALTGGAVSAAVHIPPHLRKFKKDKNVAGVKDYEQEHYSRTQAGIVGGTVAGLGAGAAAGYTGNKLVQRVYSGKLSPIHSKVYSAALGVVPLIAANRGSKIGEKWADKQNVETARHIRQEYYGGR